MTDKKYKLVPAEPTLEMVKAACDEEQLPPPMWTRMKAIYRAMLAAAPAVQGEPVELDRYDAVFLGGQDGMPAYVWHDIIRAELDRAYDFYMDQLDRATPQPAPDVSALVEALELARDRIESERRSGEWDPLLRDIDAALAAYRKKQGQRVAAGIRSDGDE